MIFERLGVVILHVFNDAPAASLEDIEGIRKNGYF
tara:strand:- start:381 stop:485 length:105 start_codon:yes stop_codon:yes gene_type:complete